MKGKVACERRRISGGRVEGSDDCLCSQDKGKEAAQRYTKKLMRKALLIKGFITYTCWTLVRTYFISVFLQHWFGCLLFSSDRLLLLCL